MMKISCCRNGKETREITQAKESGFIFIETIYRHTHTDLGKVSFMNKFNVHDYNDVMPLCLSFSFTCLLRFIFFYKHLIIGKVWMALHSAICCSWCWYPLSFLCECNYRIKIRLSRLLMGWWLSKIVVKFDDSMMES